MEWKKEKFKKLISHKSGYTWSKDQEVNKPEPNTIRVLTVSNIQQELDLSSELYLHHVSEKDKIEKAVSKGWSIAVSSNGNRKRIGNAIYINQNTDYLFASFLTAFKPKDDTDIDSEFFYRWLTSETVQERISTVSEGTTGLGNLDLRFLRQMEIYYPESNFEQKAIATILSKVDEAIETTKQSINAAEKLKKAMMQNLLTGKLKPDGTWRKEEDFYIDEKFGKIPKGWSLLPIGDNSIAKINPNYSFSKNGIFDFIPMDGINDCFRGVKYTEKKIIDNTGYTRFKKGDILFAKITPCTENGKVALINELSTDIGFASTEFIVFSPTDNIDNKFYYYLLSSDSIHNLAVSLMEGTTGRQRVPWKVFKNRIFAIFPNTLREQKAIVSNIHSIEIKISNSQIKIKSLEKLKKSLMQHLLTGKKRLSNEAIEKINQN